MKKPIEIVFLKEAEDYHQELPEKIKKKFLFSFYKVKNGYKGEWFKKLKDSDGIFEFKERGLDKFYRIFAFWDKTLESKVLIIGTHGINKKSNKTPKKEIEKAEKIKRLYFNNKPKDKNGTYNTR